jgi:hypothetical protein
MVDQSINPFHTFSIHTAELTELCLCVYLRRDTDLFGEWGAFDTKKVEMLAIPWSVSSFT